MTTFPESSKDYKVSSNQIQVKTTPTIKASKKRIPNKITSNKTEGIGTALLDEAHTKITEKPQNLKERVHHISQYLIGMVEKSIKQLPKFQKHGIYEGEKVAPEELAAALEVSLRRVKDSIKLNEDRKNNVEGTKTENKAERIKRTDELIQIKMNNLLISSLNIAKIYKKHSVVPLELKEQLQQIGELGVALNIEGADKLQELLEPRKHRYSVVAIAISVKKAALRCLRGRRRVEVVKEETPPPKINDIAESLRSIHESIKGNKKLSQTYQSLFDGSDTINQIIRSTHPSQRRAVIKPEEMPFLLTGVVSDPEFAKSFQKYSPFIMKPEKMAETIKLTLELIEAVNDPDLKQLMRTNLASACTSIADAYRVNTSVQSVVPHVLHEPISRVAKDSLTPIILEREGQKVPQFNTPKAQKYTDNTMDKIRSGTIGWKGEKEKFLKKATADLRNIGSYYIGSTSPMEFRDLAWTKKELQINAPHIIGYINATNWLINKVNKDIIESGTLEKTPKQNQKAALRMLETYIELMDSCIQDGNMMAAFSIYTAINTGYTTSMLDRMKTQEVYDITDNEMWNKATDLFSLLGNRKNLRDHIEVLSNENKPCIIDLPLTLKDLNFAAENETNGGKLEAVSKILTTFEKIKPKSPEPFPPLKTSLFDTELPKIDQKSHSSLLNAIIPKE